MPNGLPTPRNAVHAGQAESIAKQERLFETKSKNWLSWEDAQKARVRCVEKYNKATERAQKQSLLRDCLILAFHTLQPVRRRRHGKRPRAAS